MLTEPRPPSRRTTIGTQPNPRLHTHNPVCTKVGAIHIDEALAAFGRIDILVTNAGIVSRGPFATTSAATFDAHLRVHLHGTFNTCRAVWPTMLKQRYGRVVTVVSASLFGMDNVASYASAKGGILGLTKSMRSREPRTASVSTAWRLSLTPG
jgi:NAD(P)-dependent dehydrogenase (short-subunit alcohol dehydrogenase family)